MSSNFDFLSLHLVELRADALEAERLARISPRASAFQSRFVLESAAHWIYAHDPTLSRPYEDRLGAMIHEASFRDNLPPAQFLKVKAIYLTGNQAAHRSQAITPKDSLRALEELFHFLYWVSRTYSPDAAQHPKVAFDPSRVPTGVPVPELSEARIRTLQAEYEKRLATSAMRLEAREKDLARTEETLEALKNELKVLKAQNQKVPDLHNYNEDATRDQFIDLMLREAGWPLDKPGHHTEYPVTGMPNPTGNGFVDYVLWDTDGMPVGLVEAKATRHSSQKGKQQAVLYANCLERQFGRRPVIFLSNGYEHQLWDDQAGPPRPVAGFYTREELATLHWRRANATLASLEPIDPTIVERGYQCEAIRRVTEHFEAGHRRALVVMATGTGKTRTTIALIDVLLKANRVKRVLFLADRTSLLTQARRAFKRHLSRCTTVDLLRDPTGDGSIYLCTYPTMLNLIDRRDGHDRRDGMDQRATELRRFGPGFFDLVVTDEAHRSIYKKFGALFEWFDGWLLGLTATPRDDVHRDTYQLFELEKNVPTYAYELSAAVRDGFLVPPRSRSAAFRFLRRGITYQELSPEEREQYEEKFIDDDSGELPDRIEPRALNAWVFNLDTIDKAVDFIMEHGRKVAEGSRLGKTIVFARNHKHATLIVERFDLKYPHHKGKFCRVIDSFEDYAQSLLDEFGVRESAPHIAVSVDMLDTGVDIPEVVNLVFFRAVTSRTKFNQMIGRGTRLCPDLLGEGVDKDHFLIIDLCGNLEYFASTITEDEGKLAEGVAERVVKQRAQLYTLAPEEAADIRAGLIDRLHAHVKGMDLNQFRVRARRAQVELLQEREMWDALTGEEVLTTATDLSALPTSDGDDDHLTARQFDLVILKLQLGLLRPEKQFNRTVEDLRGMAANLLGKADALPLVAKQRPTLESLLQDDFWDGLPACTAEERRSAMAQENPERRALIATGLRRLEGVRLALRDIVRFADKRARQVVYTDFEDVLTTDEAVEMPLPGLDATVDLERYRRKVEAFLRDHLEQTTVWKLRHNRPLTPVDLEALEALLYAPDVAGSRVQLEQVTAGEPLPVFIRRLLGLEATAVREAFDAWQAERVLSASQLRFLDMLRSFLTKNGVMDPALLYQRPFSDVHPEGVEGVFLEPDVDQIVRILREVNGNAGLGERLVG